MKFRVVREIGMDAHTSRYVMVGDDWDGYLYSSWQAQWWVDCCCVLLNSQFEKITGIHLKPGEWCWVEMREVP